MPQLLTLRGRYALSPFRVAKLHAALAAARPGNAVSSVSAEYWHFVETERALGDAERRTLDRLLTYGAHEGQASGTHDGGAEFFLWFRDPARFRRGRRRPRTSRRTADSPPFDASSGVWRSMSRPQAAIRLAVRTVPHCCRSSMTG